MADGWHGNRADSAARREFRIAELYEEGYSPEEISGMIGISTQSVRMKLSQMGIYDRMLTKNYLQTIWPMWTAACNNLKQ